MAYDEHSISYFHNVGVFVQKEKQFTLSSFVENASVGLSKGLSSFLASFARPIRGTKGQLAYHSEQQGHELFVHPISTVKSDTERRDRMTQTMVQIVFQEDSTPFSPEFISSGDTPLETMCFVVIQPISNSTANQSSRNIRYKVSTLINEDVADFGPKLSEQVPVLSARQLKDVLVPLLINANIFSYYSRRSSSMRCRARAELFASLYEVLSGWNAQEGTYTGQKLTDLIKIPTEGTVNFHGRQNDEFKQEKKTRSDSGNSSNYYSR